ncbi:hypothetical protein EVAR_128_1 [Eumeta japonica]|uniref:Uncharacterized protein n=1 Tax=Eumeta variegata TaxID=151549 RepID=A0A4C1SBI7_EUMVA|nr:hypothetical protein EVAR_128_1 [Eumeta japonica]
MNAGCTHEKALLIVVFLSRACERERGTIERPVPVVPQFRLFLSSGCSSVAIGRLRFSPLDHPFSLVCYCVSVFLRATFRSVGLHTCTSVWGAAQYKPRGGS